MPVIDYYLIAPSPFAYLGHKAFHEIARRHGATIRYKPVSIMGVWEKSGSVPLGQRTPTRQRYRVIELQRIAEMRGLPLNLQPKFFPVDAALADRTTVAIVESGGNPEGYLGRVHAGVWANEENVADRDQIAAYLRSEGFDSDAVLALADDQSTADAIVRNTQDAIAADAIGAPVYVLDGEPFWGQDRLDLLERALATGRAPFRAS